MPAIPVKPFTDEWSLSKRGWWFGLDFCVFSDGSGGDAVKTAELLTRRLRAVGVAISYEEPQRADAQWFAFVEVDQENDIIIETTTLSDDYAEWKSFKLSDAVALLVRVMVEPTTAEHAIALIRGEGCPSTKEMVAQVLAENVAHGFVDLGAMKRMGLKP